MWFFTSQTHPEIWFCRPLGSEIDGTWHPTIHLGPRQGQGVRGGSRGILGHSAAQSVRIGRTDNAVPPKSLLQK